MKELTLNTKNHRLGRSVQEAENYQRRVSEALLYEGIDFIAQESPSSIFAEFNGSLYRLSDNGGEIHIEKPNQDVCFDVPYLSTSGVVPVMTLLYRIRQALLDEGISGIDWDYVMPIEDDFLDSL